MQNLSLFSKHKYKILDKSLFYSNDAILNNNLSTFEEFTFNNSNTGIIANRGHFVLSDITINNNTTNTLETNNKYFSNYFLENFSIDDDSVSPNLYFNIDSIPLDYLDYKDAIDLDDGGIFINIQDTIEDSESDITNLDDNFILLDQDFYKNIDFPYDLNYNFNEIYNYGTEFSDTVEISGVSGINSFGYPNNSNPSFENINFSTPKLSNAFGHYMLEIIKRNKAPFSYTDNNSLSKIQTNSISNKIIYKNNIISNYPNNIYQKINIQKIAGRLNFLPPKI